MLDTCGVTLASGVARAASRAWAEGGVGVMVALQATSRVEI